MAKNKKKKKKENENPYNVIRGSWGSLNPITRVIPNKKKDRKQKHKEKEFNENF
jgi:hypothetical protein